MTETFATALPEIMPNSALATTPTLAGPPIRRPAISSASSMKVCPPPVACSSAPNRMKIATKVAEVPVSEANSPPEEK